MTCCRASLEALETRSLSASMVTLILDVFVDPLSGSLVDALDDMAENANGAAARGLGIVPLDRLDVDAALDELGREDIDDLAGDEIGRGGDGEELVRLGQLDRGAGVFQVIALGEFARRLLVGVVDLLQVDFGHNVEARVFCHSRFLSMRFDTDRFITVRSSARRSSRRRQGRLRGW